jgi:hypothetical protein
MKSYADDFIPQGKIAHTFPCCMLEPNDRCPGPLRRVGPAFCWRRGRLETDCSDNDTWQRSARSVFHQRCNIGKWFSLGVFKNDIFFFATWFLASLLSSTLLSSPVYICLCVCMRSLCIWKVFLALAWCSMEIVNGIDLTHNPFWNLYVTVCSSTVFFVPEQLARCVVLIRNKCAVADIFDIRRPMALQVP